MSENKEPKKKSVRPTRAVQGDRSKRVTGMPPDESLVEQMELVVHPAVYGQMDMYRALGLRTRILTLPVMVGFMLGLLWRQIGSVREGMLWIEPIEGVTVQAMLARMNHLPAELFRRVLMDCLPIMQSRAQVRQHFDRIWACDGSTLDAVLKKCGLLREQSGVVLAGKLATVFDIVTQLPAHIWYEANSDTHDHSFWPLIMEVLQAGSLLLLDRGFIDFAVFDQLTEKHVGFITRPKSNTRTQVRQVLSNGGIR